MHMKGRLATLCLFISSITGAVGSTIVVDNTVDPGDGVCASPGCTLREAITAANANPGADIINFNIAGAGVHTITPTSALPDITDAVTIDGYTQPGASANTLAVGDNAVLLIELNGTSAGPFGTSGLRLTSDGSLVRGLVINRFADSGIFISDAVGNVIEGNFIGTNAAGTADLGNAYRGVSIIASDSNLVGGPMPSARNVISGNGFYGVWISGLEGSDNAIKGNYIGTDRNGTAA